MSEPLAVLLTWTTYGTWLPGDERGWVERGGGFQLPDPIRKREAEARMTEDACVLDLEQRLLVENTITDHCRIRGWQLHIVNCRTNHVHAVVTVDRDPDEAREQFKAWCTRHLKGLERTRGGRNPPCERNGGQNGEASGAYGMNQAWRPRFNMYATGNEAP